ncbi:MAG: GDP-mannose 4,6-dehydratase [Anaerolineales bacterium]|nr:GDP-mannose 4,6-dehydratase [Anaerolineales bacterium]
MTIKKWDSQNVLVTGGAGFIGSHLVEKLVEVGMKVAIIDDFSSGHIQNLKNVAEKVEIHEKDIIALDWKDFLENNHFDYIFHLAGNAYVPPSIENPAHDYKVNLYGTFRLLEALRESAWKGKLIFASSAAVYGNPLSTPIKETDPTIPISPYGVAKLAAERYIEVFSKIYDLKAVSLRFFSLYGPRQKKQVVFDFCRKIEQNKEKLHIFGDGSQVRDFNYVTDTVEALLLTAQVAPAQGEVYNVASGKESSISDLAKNLCDIFRISPEIVYSGSVRPGDADKWAVNISSLMSLGYHPVVSLQEGLQRTVDWYLSDGSKGTFS